MNNQMCQLHVVPLNGVFFTFPSIRLELQNTTNKAIQLQTHPNIDKELFKTRSVIGLKNPAKPFPVNTGVGVLKWRLL